MRPRIQVLSLVAVLGIVAGCNQKKESTTPDDATAQPAAADLVNNVDAQPGDTTTCPFSGRPFVVKAEHPKVDYEGAQYWICSDDAAEKVRADPGKYLDGFEG